MFRVASLSLILVFLGGIRCFEDNDLYGISHLTFVVTDLELSRRFYTDVIGGMVVEGLGTGQEGVFGNSHFYRIFQKEIVEARRNGRSLNDVGVPDIGDNGDHKVVWEFILLSNTLIQLMTFVNRFNNQVFVRSDPRRGNAFVTSTHSALFADDSVVALQQIQDIINRQNSIPFYPEDMRGFIANQEVDSFGQRRSLKPDSYLFALRDNFRLAVMRGPQGERWEISYRRGTGLINDLAIYCKEKGVFPTLSDTRMKNRYQDTPSKRFVGVSHTNAVSDDMEATIKFYVDVLGGKQNKEKTNMNRPIGLGFLRLIFQDEELDARKQGMAPDEYFGILPAKTGDSQPKFDISFILFDNFYMEPYRYYMNDSYRRVPQYLYRDWSSPAYTNNLHTGFWVKDDIDMTSFIKDMEAKSRRLGLFQVIANRAVNVNTRGQAVQDDEYSGPFPENHKLAGYDYVYFKGPAGEQLVLTQFLGKARQTLKAAMEEYGAVSTAYDSVNPWKWDGFDRNCEWLTK